MPPTVNTGLILHATEHFEVGTVSANVRYTLSNGLVVGKDHDGLPLAALNAAATAAGRSRWAPEDIATVLASNPDLSGITYSVAAPPPPPAPEVPAPEAPAPQQ